MATEVIMPKAGMAMERGTVVQWFKQPGDYVEAGEPLLEIETDKVAMEVEAEVSGYLLSILHDSGDEVEVITTIGYIGEKDEHPPAGGAPETDGTQETGGAHETAGANSADGTDRESSAVGGSVGTGNTAGADAGGRTASSPGGAAPSAALADADTPGKVPATPAARRLAVELNVPLDRTQPTGVWGEVRARDVEKLSEQMQGAGGGPIAPVAPAAPTAPAAAGRYTNAAGHTDAAGQADTAGPGGRAAQTSERVSPLAAQLAEERGIDLSTIHGSGPGGRIVKRDVVEQGAPGRTYESAPALEEQALQPGAGPFDAAGRRTNRTPHRKPASAMRRTIAERMLASHQSVPPVTLNRSVRVDALLELRAQIKRETDTKVSINDFVVKATALTLKDAPYMRTVLDGTDLVVMEDIDIGIAVALEEGLLVPVVRNVDTITLSELAGRSRQLARRARERKLEPDDMTGGCFTVTNLGMYGISSFTPIVNPPQSGILGVNAVQEELYLQDRRVESRKVLPLSLTVDHRVVDGAQGAIFLQSLAEFIEQPMSILA